MHIVVESDEPLPRGQSRGTNGPDGMKLEIFKKKYVVMTGKIMGRRREIKKRTEKLQQLHALTVMERYAADPQPVDDAASDTRRVGEIVAECIGDYRNGRKFQTWHQYGAAAGDDRSAVDYGYACQIAAHTHDPALIEAVMRSGAMLRPSGTTASTAAGCRTTAFSPPFGPPHCRKDAACVTAMAGCRAKPAMDTTNDSQRSPRLAGTGGLHR